jgi:hypothetical protein
MAAPFSSQPVLTHPITALASEIVIIALVLAFTARSSIIRLAVLPVVAGISWFLVHTAVQRLRAPWGTLAGGIGFVFLLQFIETVLLKPRGFEAEPSDWTIPDKKSRDDKLNGHITCDSRRNPSGQRADEDTPWNRLCFGLSTTCSLRGIGSLREAKNVPHFSGTDTSYVPSRANFLLQGIGISLFAYLFLDCASLAAHPELNSVNFAPKKIVVLRRLGDIDREEMIVRSTTIIAVWLSLFIYLQLVYGVMKVPAVVLGISDVAAWPPLFGSVIEAFTLRQFWG